MVKSIASAVSSANVLIWLHVGDHRTGTALLAKRSVEQRMSRVCNLEYKETE